MTNIKRTYWFSNSVNAVKLSDGSPYPSGTNEEMRRVPHVEAANLVASELENGNHAPALDIDLPCQLIESQTPGHYHLYIAKEMSWRKYKRLLKELAKAGILEKRYVKHSIKKKKSCLRTPYPKYVRQKIEA